MTHLRLQQALESYCLDFISSRFKSDERHAEDACILLSSGLPSICPSRFCRAAVKAAGGINTQALVKFFLPTLAIWLIGPSLSLIDTAVVGSKSSTQLAALGPGCILCDCNGYFFTFLAVASELQKFSHPDFLYSAGLCQISQTINSSPFCCRPNIAEHSTKLPTLQ